MAASDGILSKYNLRPIKTLGEGASCRVVLATRKSDNLCVAMKIMSKTKKVHEVMYNNEIKILSELKQSNIIRLVEYGMDTKDFYIVSQYATGGELFDRIVSEEWNLTEKSVAIIIRDMLRAINYLHKLQIVHRDLKPENFLFESKDKDAKIILIDFGTALVVEDDKSYDDLVGTPYYLAPESASSQKSRTGAELKASDIWAVGVIAYICLTGSPPFYGKTNRDICKAIVRNKLRFPARTEFSKAFVEFCTKCLKKRPSQRMTMDEALMHRWVIGDAASDSKINLDIVRSLRQFKHQSKLKKAVAKILAQNMGQGPEDKIKEHFRRVDIDKNGALDLKELTIMFKELGFHQTEASQEADRVMKEADSDGNDAITFDEFAAVWQRKLLSVNDQYVRAVFNVLDSNGDGEISFEELKGILQDVDDEDIKSIISEVDKEGNNDQKINFAEFKMAMKEKIGGLDVKSQYKRLDKSDVFAE